MNERVQAGPLIQLPQDVTAAVITMDSRGGYPCRVDNRPLLTIFANGTVRVIDDSRTKISAEELQDLLRVIEDSGIKFSAEERQNLLRVDTDEHSDVGPEIEARVSAEELQDLLRYAIVDHHFFDFDSVAAQQDLEAEERKTGLRMIAVDSVKTVIRIRTAERDHKGEFYDLYHSVTAYPAVKQLVNFYAVEKRLLRLFHEVRAGGKGSIATALTLANEYLQRTYPSIPPLVLEDFLYINYTPDGRTMYFVPTPAVSKQPDYEDGFRKVIFGEAKFSVAVEYVTGGAPKIKVLNPPG